MMLEIDLNFHGVPRVICCFADPDGEWIIDPGPESSHSNLIEALPDGWEPRRIMLTHIHFDHAGATGRLLERWPNAEVWVHERGARHLIDPQRLVVSAQRVYGDDFHRLWGDVVPIPPQNVRPVADGDTLDDWRVAYTPGHASHHVSYLQQSDGSAFTGDVTGIRIEEGPVIPPTPPPDIDRELWIRSLEQVAAWEPISLRITHFGTWTDVGPHLEAMRDGLVRWGDFARRTDARDFADAIGAFLEKHTTEAVTRTSYDRANPADSLWHGWARYWART